MRIDIHSPKRERLFTVEVDASDPPSVVRPPASSNKSGDGDAVDGKSDTTAVREVYLKWEQAVDDTGHLRRCPVCGCRELFVRKDFPQVTGFVIVVLAAVVATGLLGVGEVVWGIAVLVTVALIDAAVFLFTGRCLVCYRCRSEFRDLPISRGHPGWELATGEKYRQDVEVTPENDRSHNEARPEA